MVVKRHGSCKSRSDYRLVLSSGSGFPLRTRQDTPTILSFSSTARADNTGCKFSCWGVSEGSEMGLAHLSAGCWKWLSFCTSSFDCADLFSCGTFKTSPNLYEPGLNLKWNLMRSERLSHICTDFGYSCAPAPKQVVTFHSTLMLLQIRQFSSSTFLEKTTIRNAVVKHC